jgi:hypothetical protein
MCFSLNFSHIICIKFCIYLLITLPFFFFFLKNHLENDKIVVDIYLFFNLIFRGLIMVLVPFNFDLIQRSIADIKF